MRSKVITVTGAQMLVTKDVQQNEKRIFNGIDEAAANGADFLLTPESAVSGNYPDFDREQVTEAVNRIAQKAKNAGIGLILGTCYKQIEDGNEYCYNQARVYAPSGEYLGFYAKILRCSSLEYPGSGAMSRYIEGVPRIFEWEGIKFGILICNDMWATPGFTTIPNNYLPWRLKQMGAEFIVHPISASGTDLRYKTFHESSVELWAFALKTHIIEINKAPENGKVLNTASGLVGKEGQRLIKAPDDGEHFFTCQIKL